MKKFSKFLCVALALATSLSVVACKKDKGESNKGTTSNVIEFAYLQAGFGLVPYEKLAEAYMAKNPGVQVKLRPDHEINSNVDNQVNNDNNLADVYSIRDVSKIKIFALNGKVEDLTSLLNSKFGEGYQEAENTVKSNILDKAITDGTLNGKCYAIPEYTSINGFVYNQSLFEEYGWEIPTTTKELEELCEQILTDTDNKVAPIIFCGAPNSADGYLYFAVDNWLDLYAGIENLDEFYEYTDKETFNPNSEISKGKILAHENLLKFFSPIEYGGYAYNASMSTNHTLAQGNIIQKKAAMMLNGSWFENEMRALLNENPDIKLGMFRLPDMTDDYGNVLRAEGYTTVDDKPVINASYGAYYFIPKKAKNKELAIDFLRFLNSDEASIIYTRYTNAPRPLNYNLDPSSADYQGVSFFGNSVISMAHECYLYAPTSSNPLSLDGVISLYPKGAYHTMKLLQDSVNNNITDLITDDYNYVCNNWDKWQANYFG